MRVESKKYMISENKKLHIVLPLLIAAFSVVVFLFLSQKDAEAPVVATTEKEDEMVTEAPLPTPPLFEYIEVMQSCGPYHGGECLNARSGPGTEFPSITTLRKGVVLKVSGKEIVNGTTWYKVVFDEWLRYYDRLPQELYVSADFVRHFTDEGPRTTPKENLATSTKRILIDISTQTLAAYEGDTLFMWAPVSTGVSATPTARGTFWIFRKTPSRYMQGPIPDVSEKIYDLPGVPWDLYFTEEGAVIHGAYWHDHFGKPWSNGCVNLSPENAQKLYYWADVGVPVFIEE